MSNTGLRVYTASGDVVINDTYTNFWYDKKATENSPVAYDFCHLTAIGCSPSNNGKKYVFSAEPQEPSEHGVGLQVINESGKVIYDSNWKSLKVLHYSNEGGYVLPQGKDCAIITCSSTIYYYYEFYIDFPAYDTWGYAGEDTVSVENGTIVINKIKEQGTNDGKKVSGYSKQGNTVYMVIDVSHIK